MWSQHIPTGTGRSTSNKIYHLQSTKYASIPIATPMKIVLVNIIIPINKCPGHPKTGGILTGLLTLPMGHLAPSAEPYPGFPNHCHGQGWRLRSQRQRDSCSTSEMSKKVDRSNCPSCFFDGTIVPRDGRFPGDPHGRVGWGMITFFALADMVGATQHHGMGWGGVGDDNVPCTCTHGRCYATSTFLYLHTWSVLRNIMGWGGVGWGMITFLALAHMVAATQHQLSCTCTHGRCYATSWDGVGWGGVGWGMKFVKKDVTHSS